MAEETSDIEAEGGMFLHPDHAYMGGSRRGSSQSEQLEFEPYQLSRDFSRSLPGSRRSSFQSTQDKGFELYINIPSTYKIYLMRLLYYLYSVLICLHYNN